jgi:hypothetical protein
MDPAENIFFEIGTSLPEPKFLNLEYFFGRILDSIQSFFQLLAYLNSLQSIKIFFSLVVLFFIFLIFYYSVRILELRKKERIYLESEIKRYAEKIKMKQEKMDNASIKNPRWITVLDYLKSENSSDWKLAILEADTMLEDLTERLNITGENIGERLKNTNKENFKSLNDAWEAHIVRNKIAHEGALFEITQKEANRVIYLYENVFREFGFI